MHHDDKHDKSGGTLCESFHQGQRPGHANQLRQLRTTALNRAGLSKPSTLTGQAANEDREQFQAMFDGAFKRSLTAFSSGRWTDSAAKVRSKPCNICNANQLRCRVQSYTEQYLDGTGIFRDAIIGILAALAKQERVRLSERVQAGLARAKAQVA